ncbi:MAG: hypothetical protein V4618_14210 [Pseudomonadota bacterium]
MSDLGENSSYFLLRAKQEEEQAAAAEKPEAVAAHRELAMRYSVKALLAHVEDDEDQ